MPSAREIAQQQYVEQQQLVRAASAAGVALWQQIDPVNLAASWMGLLARLRVVVGGAQLAAASAADKYVAEVLYAQGIDVDAAGRVRASALAGVASDGRSLDRLLLNPVIATKRAIGAGAPMPRALASGQATLEMTLRTQVADAGRVAAGVAIAVRPRAGWVRMLVGPTSCARCVILAGRFYRYSSGFLRHPNDDCISIPAVEDTAGDFRTDPRKAFEEGRVRGLTAAEDQAVRDGADLAQVVNARRGMSAAGTTTEGTSRRGVAGSRLGGSPRLMPEAIYQRAATRAEAVELLRQHGYIL